MQLLGSGPIEFWLILILTYSPNMNLQGNYNRFHISTDVYKACGTQYFVHLHVNTRIIITHVEMYMQHTTSVCEAVLYIIPFS